VKLTREGGTWKQVQEKSQVKEPERGYYNRYGVPITKFSYELMQLEYHIWKLPHGTTLEKVNGDLTRILVWVDEDFKSCDSSSDSE